MTVVALQQHADNTSNMHGCRQRDSCVARLGAAAKTASATEKVLSVIVQLSYTEMLPSTFRKEHLHGQSMPGPV